MKIRFDDKLSTNKKGVQLKSDINLASTALGLIILSGNTVHERYLDQSREQKWPRDHLMLDLAYLCRTWNFS